MNRSIIMTYSPKEISLYNRDNNKSIKGSWLYELAKKISPYETDTKISLFGFDKLNRIEIEVSLQLFDELKINPLFIMKTDNLRRLRLHRKSNTLHVLEYLCYPNIKYFDNDLDLVQSIEKENNL